MSEVMTEGAHVAGFTTAGVHAGLKKDEALDIALIISDRDCAAGAMFTRNRIKAAPVLVNQEHFALNPQRMRAVAVNTVSANAATGEMGLLNSRDMARHVATQIGCEPEQVFVMSTGVIGTQLPMEKIRAGLNLAYDQQGNDWHATATAITTTDSFPKLASVVVETPAGKYTITGITKGAGMIAPNMATMLGIVVTDAQLSPEFAQKALTEAGNLSYNRIVVDGDTSTNDMVVLLANGASGCEIASGADFRQFTDALTQLTTYLAQQVVRDGEGATKFITIKVKGAQSTADAEKIAHTVASSALVKTAFYGNDANWGRIVAAAGRAGVAFDANCMSLWISVDGDEGHAGHSLVLFKDGAKADYDESEATAIISADNVAVTLDLGTGEGEAIVWTCDLSHEYVSINAEYRT